MNDYVYIQGFLEKLAQAGISHDDFVKIAGITDRALKFIRLLKPAAKETVTAAENVKKPYIPQKSLWTEIEERNARDRINTNTFTNGIRTGRQQLFDEKRGPWEKSQENYIQGFMDKCAQYGVDPSMLINIFKG